MKKVLISALTVATLLAGTISANTPKAEAGIVDTVVDNTKALATAVIAKFKDVKGHWAESVISKASELKLITGYQDGTFKPNGEITRAEFAAILSRSTNLEKVEGSNPFPDMKGNWAETYVTQLAAQGFINPGDYPNGFNPNTKLTRYEEMKWIANGLIKSNDSFKQAFEDTKNTLLPTPEATRGEISKDKVPYIALARGTGIVTGFEDGSLKPQNTTTRAEVAAIILRYMSAEGKNADSFSGLNELREVGKTGSNVISLTGYKYNTATTFADIINTPITLTNKSAQVKLKRFIVVDATSNKLSGIYSTLFHSKVADWQKGRYITYMQMDFTSLTDKPSILTYAAGIRSTLLYFNKINDANFVKSAGIENWPQTTATYFKKGEAKTVWSTWTMDPKGLTGITNDKGAHVSIQKD
ncbi:S-layer homology domain-containing protein [Paenibacillus sp. Y412MC10]|uniref:S-layer homology domain-containing protein n=1 Tax=Geobacillus sp. (strain Y412MC10) TaxID=481743 RepID=UPI0011AB3658|nr:S-layer homology domain-containing protein [Paenibacillus sp. Y412MC10]